MVNWNCSDIPHHLEKIKVLTCVSKGNAHAVESHWFHFDKVRLLGW